MSDQTQSIFGNNSVETPANNSTEKSNVIPESSGDPYADLLGKIKNDKGEPKYKSVQEALNGLLHAQSFISTLTQEKKQTEEELSRAKADSERIQALEETLDRLRSGQETTPKTPGVEIDESKIAEMVSRTLSVREKETLARQNISSVTSILNETYGKDAETKFYGKASELGLSKEEMNALAARSPQAVLSMLGVTAPGKEEKVFTPTQGTQNTSGLQSGPTSFIGRNPKTALLGATTDDLRESSKRADKMVEELHSKGMTVSNLADPKQFFKFFGK